MQGQLCAHSTDFWSFTAVQCMRRVLLTSVGWPLELSYTLCSAQSRSQTCVCSTALALLSRVQRSNVRCKLHRCQALVLSTHNCSKRFLLNVLTGSLTALLNCDELYKYAALQPLKHMNHNAARAPVAYAL
jgi:hypothetical protein